MDSFVKFEFNPQRVPTFISGESVGHYVGEPDTSLNPSVNVCYVSGSTGNDANSGASGFPVLTIYGAIEKTIANGYSSILVLDGKIGYYAPVTLPVDLYCAVDVTWHFIDAFDFSPNGTMSDVGFYNTVWDITQGSLGPGYTVPALTAVISYYRPEVNQTTGLATWAVYSTQSTGTDLITAFHSHGYWRDAPHATTQFNIQAIYEPGDGGSGGTDISGTVFYKPGELSAYKFFVIYQEQVVTQYYFVMIKIDSSAEYLSAQFYVAPSVSAGDAFGLTANNIYTGLASGADNPIVWFNDGSSDCEYVGMSSEIYDDTRITTGQLILTSGVPTGPTASAPFTSLAGLSHCLLDGSDVAFWVDKLEGVITLVTFTDIFTIAPANVESLTTTNPEYDGFLRASFGYSRTAGPVVETYDLLPQLDNYIDIYGGVNRASPYGPFNGYRACTYIQNIDGQSVLNYITFNLATIPIFNDADVYNTTIDQEAIGWVDHDIYVPSGLVFGGDAKNCFFNGVGLELESFGVKGNSNNSIYGSLFTAIFSDSVVTAKDNGFVGVYICSNGAKLDQAAILKCVYAVADDEEIINSNISQCSGSYISFLVKPLIITNCVINITLSANRVPPGSTVSNTFFGNPFYRSAIQPFNLRLQSVDQIDPVESPAIGRSSNVSLHGGPREAGAYDDFRSLATTWSSLKLPAPWMLTNKVGRFTTQTRGLSTGFKPITAHSVRSIMALLVFKHVLTDADTEKVLTLLGSASLAVRFYPRPQTQPNDYLNGHVKPATNISKSVALLPDMFDKMKMSFEGVAPRRLTRIL